MDTHNNSFGRIKQFALPQVQLTWVPDNAGVTLCSFIIEGSVNQPRKIIVRTPT